MTPRFVVPSHRGLDGAHVLLHVKVVPGHVLVVSNGMIKKLISVKLSLVNVTNNHALKSAFVRALMRTT